MERSAQYMADDLLDYIESAAVLNSDQKKELKVITKDSELLAVAKMGPYPKGVYLFGIVALGVIVLTIVVFIGLQPLLLDGETADNAALVGIAGVAVGALAGVFGYTAAKQ